MAAANIKINGVALSNDDLPINTLVTLDNANTGGELTFLWSILDQPPGAADALSSTIIQSPTFTPKKEGTYLLKLIVNQGQPTEVSDTKIAGVRQLKTRERVPAAGETTQDSSTRGWAGAAGSFLQRVDGLAADPGVIVGVVATGAPNVSVGDVLIPTTTETLKSGLPGQESVTGWKKTNALLTAGVDAQLGVCLGAVDGTAGPFVPGKIIRVRKSGLYTLIPIVVTPVTGDPLYVDDSGAISNIAGTVLRQIGSVTRVGGGTYDAWIDGSFGAHNYATTSALWSGIRYFAVDYDNGNDLNLGFSDSSMSAAGAVAFKTLTKLKSFFPKFGNGQKAVVAVRRRAGGATYRDPTNSIDDDLDFLNEVYGYDHLLVRGTDTNATAGSTAFLNNAADKVFAGGQQVAGTNVGGYNPTGAPTANTFTLQLNGGGAPALAAEPALIGKRIRFDSATTTVALRNACAMIWSNGAATLTTGKNLPAVPALADIFYIEEPGVQVNRVICRSSNPSNIAAPPSFTNQGIHIVGFRAMNVAAPGFLLRGHAASVVVSFCESPSTSFSALTSSQMGALVTAESYQDESPATITPGVGFRTEGGITVATAMSYTATSCACIQARWQLLQIVTFSVGGGCFSFLGALVQGCGAASTPSTPVGGLVIGNNGSATVQRFRTTSTFTESISITSSNVVLWGCDITGVGATPLINVNGVGININVQDVVGSTGNTGVGIDLSKARDCKLLLGTTTANTFTGAAGKDIRGGGVLPEVFYVHADYARTDLWDAQGNHIQGTAGALMPQPTLLTNDGNANIIQYAVTRITATGVVRAAQANTAANAAGVVGVSQSAFTSAGPQNAMHATGCSTWIQFDGVPVAGNIAYLSVGTIGNATTTIPPLAATNQKMRLGRVMKVSGTLGLVNWNPDALAVLADGLA